MRKILWLSLDIDGKSSREIVWEMGSLTGDQICLKFLLLCEQSTLWVLSVDSSECTKPFVKQTARNDCPYFFRNEDYVLYFYARLQSDIQILFKNLRPAKLHLEELGFNSTTLKTKDHLNGIRQKPIHLTWTLSSKYLVFTAISIFLLLQLSQATLVHSSWESPVLWVTIGVWKFALTKSIRNWKSK